MCNLFAAAQNPIISRALFSDSYVVAVLTSLPRIVKEDPSAILSPLVCILHLFCTMYVYKHPHWEMFCSDVKNGSDDKSESICACESIAAWTSWSVRTSSIAMSLPIYKSTINACAKSSSPGKQQKLAVQRSQTIACFFVSQLSDTSFNCHWRRH